MSTPEERLLAAMLPVLEQMSDDEIERAMTNARQRLSARTGYVPVADCSCCRLRRHVYGPDGIGPCLICDHAFRTAPARSSPESG